MQVKFWGVRGSTPTPQAENLRYGGNTSCVEVRVKDQIFIFDCGTGFRVLGRELEREFGERPFAAHVFVSHFHWDHIQGIPFFRPLYDSPNGHFYFHSSSRQPSLEQVMSEQMESPYFPVNLDQMRARREFCNIQNGCLDMEDGIRIKTAWLNHPQGCLGFRLETNDGVLVYATDNEPGDENFDKAVRKLAEGADILIYDAQYLPEEYAARAVAGATAIGARRSMSLWKAAPRNSSSTTTIRITRISSWTRSWRMRRITTAECAPLPRACKSGCRFSRNPLVVILRSHDTALPEPKPRMTHTAPRSTFLLDFRPFHWGANVSTRISVGSRGCVCEHRAGTSTRHT